MAGMGMASVASVAAVVRGMSAEVIQEQEAADEDGEGNPEVDVGGDHSNQGARSSELSRGL